MQKSSSSAEQEIGELTRLDAVGGPGTIDSGVHDGGWRKYAYLIIVGLPTLLSAAYFFAFSAKRYETEVQFVVQSPNSADAGSFAGVMKVMGVSLSVGSAQVVEAYVSSNAATLDLVRDADILKLVSKAGWDVFWQYPGLFRTHKIERLHRYLQDMISIKLDSQTGVSTLKVQAFTPEDSVQIANVLLKNSEQLINRLSERSKRNAIEMAQSFVDEAQSGAKLSLEDVTKFRSQNQLIDPLRNSATESETITKLAVEGAQTRARLKELELTSPSSQQVQALKLRIQAIDEQLKVQRESLGGKGNSLAVKIAEYERLMLRREFSEKTLGSALTSLELARNDAMRQNMFLERISGPLVPDYAKYPRRFVGIITTFLMALAAYYLASRILRDVRSHDTG